MLGGCQVDALQLLSEILMFLSDCFSWLKCSEHVTLFCIMSIWLWKERALTMKDSATETTALCPCPPTPGPIFSVAVTKSEFHASRFILISGFNLTWSTFMVLFLATDQIRAEKTMKYEERLKGYLTRSLGGSIRRFGSVQMSSLSSSEPWSWRVCFAIIHCRFMDSCSNLKQDFPHNTDLQWYSSWHIQNAHAFPCFICHSNKKPMAPCPL